MPNDIQTFQYLCSHIPSFCGEAVTFLFAHVFYTCLVFIKHQFVIHMLHRFLTPHPLTWLFFIEAQNAITLVSRYSERLRVPFLTKPTTHPAAVMHYGLFKLLLVQKLGCPFLLWLISPVWDNRWAEWRWNHWILRSWDRKC